ncbi:polysaccharide deacetylase family protein [Gillisia limnaea]|uniref:Polysaccharide deacetylase n=1 Tax=Gillisia limnaea (strain DSM 15749 / LMG 21470 / R-8282) TaxID=865937 RepID=H2BRS5_GILLR|nr:polysaccharide deacetylase family protein [Gillisia limnaea]EHQ01390.1 polysaccharide deacetylase [Gillisia limnaea DSM 15749]
MNESTNGFLVISLDFELLWGVFDKVDYKEKETYFKNTRKVIPEILGLFSEYDIHCTWATVGMLFNKNWEEWRGNKLEILPDYKNTNLSAYVYGKALNSTETEFFCFAKDLIQQIQNTPHQEVGTHTYSHYYCLEEGQTLAFFKADLEKSIELAKQMGIELKSLVFPRNQFNEDYLKVCYYLGIENVRSNPIAWYWKDTQNDSLKNKIFRTGDAYLGSNNKSYKLSDLDVEKGKPLSQKASRLLRPYSTNKFLNNLKLKRIKSEMSFAAKNNEVYHLWWHPHNFGNNSDENLSDLKKILQHYKFCNAKYGFKSLNMKALGEKLRSEI